MNKKYIVRSEIEIEWLKKFFSNKEEFSKFKDTRYTGQIIFIFEDSKISNNGKIFCFICISGLILTK